MAEMALQTSDHLIPLVLRVRYQLLLDQFIGADQGPFVIALDGPVQDLLRQPHYSGDKQTNGNKQQAIEGQIEARHIRTSASLNRP